MKKILFAFAALAAMVSCSNDELVELNQQAIAFGDTFVDNATRALNDDYSGTKELTSFKVYGTISGTTTGTGQNVKIFDGATVTRNSKNFGVAWDCDQTEYWVPNATYNFAAIVDGEAATYANNLPATINYTIGGGDLLYGTVSTTTDANATASGLTNNLVAFTMNHLLSKVQFTVKNNSGSSKYTYAVTSVNVTGVAEKGIYTIGATTPWAQDGATTTELAFGTTAVIGNTASSLTSEDHLVVPVNQTLNITLAYDIYFNGEKISSDSITKDLTYTFGANKVYNITAIIPAPGNPIQFTIAENGVGGWTAADSDINL